MRRPLLALLASSVLVAACTGTDDGLVSADETGTTTTVAPTTTTTEATTTTTEATTTTTEPTTTTVAPNFADAFETVRSGVFLVEATYCDGSAATGTGFLVGPDRVITAAHVTGDAATVTVRNRPDDFEATGTVFGLDVDRDLSLLVLDRLSEGHRFTIDDDGLRVGEEVAALGHPRGLPLTFTSGRVSALDYTDDYLGDVSFHQTDAPINPGNSGGPLIDVEGHVVGMADWKFSDLEGISFVVAADEITAALGGGSLQQVGRPVGCDLPPDDGAGDISLLIETETALWEFADLITAGDAGAAYDRFYGPRLLELVPRDEFIDNTATSRIEDMTVLSAVEVAPGEAEVLATFVSRQSAEDGPDGLECARWDIVYDMIRTDGWRIQRATNQPGSPQPCDA